MDSWILTSYLILYRRIWDWRLSQKALVSNEGGYLQQFTTTNQLKIHDVSLEDQVWAHLGRVLKSPIDIHIYNFIQILHFFSFSHAIKEEERQVWSNSREPNKTSNAIELNWIHKCKRPQDRQEAVNVVIILWYETLIKSPLLISPTACRRILLATSGQRYTNTFWPFLLCQRFMFSCSPSRWQPMTCMWNIWSGVI